MAMLNMHCFLRAQRAPFSHLFLNFAQLFKQPGPLSALFSGLPSDLLELHHLQRFALFQILQSVSVPNENDRE